MSAFNRARRVADRLLAKGSNGPIALVRIVFSDGPNEWDPAAGSIQVEDLTGFATGVPSEMVDGETVRSSDELVRCSVPPQLQPKTGDTVVLDHTFIQLTSGNIETDGRVARVEKVIPIFGAGEPVALRLVVRG